MATPDADTVRSLHRRALAAVMVGSRAAMRVQGYDPRNTRDAYKALMYNKLYARGDVVQRYPLGANGERGPEVVLPRVVVGGTRPAKTWPQSRYCKDTDLISGYNHSLVQRMAQAINGLMPL